MVSKDLLLLTFDAVLKFEGEEGECQFGFCCLRQHGQECTVDRASPAPAAGGQETFEGIMK